MIDDKLGALVSILIEMTKASQIKWQVTSDRNIYIYTAPDVTIEIIFDYDDDTNEPHVIVNLRNAQGEIIDRLSVSGSEADQYDIFYDLFIRARKNANNVDKIVDNLIVRLKTIQADAKKAQEEDLPF